MDQKNDKQELIFEAINELAKKINEQDKKIASLENTILEHENISIIQNQTINQPASISPTPSPVVNFENIQKPTEEPANIEDSSNSNLEENIGIKWFARIGITAFILGISFFLKYAFDNDWIGPAGRVIIGIMSGLVLLSLGEKYIRKYKVYGQIMSGGGIAVLYLSIFAAFNFYSLIGQLPAFLFMILVTAVGIGLSIRYDAISLVMVSIAGGFATPFLVSNGQNNQIGLLSYILLLDCGILAVSVFKKWRQLNLVGLTGTVIIFAAWFSEFYRSEDLFLTMFFLTLFFLVYSVSSLIYNLVKKENSSGAEQALIILSASIYFSASYALLNHDYHVFMGFFALLMGIYYFLWAYLIRALTPEDENLYNFSAFLTIAFITLAIPIQFEQKIITMAWVIEAAVLIILGAKVKKEVLKGFGLLIFGLALIRLFFIDSYYSKDDLMIVVNKTFAVFIFSIIISYATAWIIKFFQDQNEDEKKFTSVKQMMAVLIISANFLTVFAVSREINKYYADKISQLEKIEARELGGIDQIGNNSRLHTDGYYTAKGSYSAQIKNIKNKNSVSLSIFWLVYGIILLAIGISKKYKGVRVGGLILFTLAILKLFFYDLWNLGTLYRIISSISLGMVLLSISFFYQKYKDKIKEII